MTASGNTQTPSSLLSHEDINKDLFHKGKHVYAEGDPAVVLCIIQSGSIGIFKKIDGETVRISTHTAGEMFGELALIEGSRRETSAVALEDSTVIKTPKNLLDAKLNVSDPFVRALLKIVVTNMRQVQRTYMRRPRSYQDCLNALSQNAEKLGEYLDKPPCASFRDNAKSRLGALRTGIGEMRELFKGHEDKRDDVLIDEEFLGPRPAQAKKKAQFVNRMRHLVTAAARQARSLAPGARPTRWNQLR